MIPKYIFMIDCKSITTGSALRCVSEDCIHGLENLYIRSGNSLVESSTKLIFKNTIRSAVNWVSSCRNTSLTSIILGSMDSAKSNQKIKTHVTDIAIETDVNSADSHILFNQRDVSQ